MERLRELGYSQTSGDRFHLSEESRDEFKQVRSSVSTDMLGMGVSSYSHLDDTIFRNQMDLDTYVQAVSRGDLPVMSGKRYSEEEDIIAGFVLGLKNGLKLSDTAKKLLMGSMLSCFRYWNGVGPEGKLYTIFANYTKYRKRIPKLIKHGLLEFDGNTLQFTQKGRLFENEVCRTLYSRVMDAKLKGQRVRAFFAENFLPSNRSPQRPRG